MLQKHLIISYYALLSQNERDIFDNFTIYVYLKGYIIFLVVVLAMQSNFRKLNVYFKTNFMCVDYFVTATSHFILLTFQSKELILELILDHLSMAVSSLYHILRSYKLPVIPCFQNLTSCYTYIPVISFYLFPLFDAYWCP